MADDLDDADWRDGASIYHIWPRSFLDANGDGIGDLAGVRARLDYVASLGVDAIWLSPFFTSPMRDFGYDVSNYRDVDRSFGALEDFDALLADAHARGLKILIDQVYSHTSDRHPWFAESRADRTNAKSDWYVWADPKPDGAPPNNWQSVFGGPAWEWDARRGQYYLHNFLPSQPDLNLHKEEVRDALLDVARYWLERGVDGFRLDAINFAMHDPDLRDNPPTADAGRAKTRPFDFQDPIRSKSHPSIPTFLERLRALTDAYDRRLTIAEVAGPGAADEMRSFIRPGHLHSAYSFDFLYAGDIDPDFVRATAGAWGEADGAPSWAFSNHDAPRAVSRWLPGAPDRTAAAKLLVLLLASLRGNVILYQGEELGLPQAVVPYDELQDPEAIANWPATLGRDGARTPMPWRADAPHAGFSDARPWFRAAPEHAEFAVDVQNADAGSTLAFTRRVFNLRRASAALRRGSLTFADDAPGGILAFERRAPGERLLCLFNLCGDERRYGAPGETVVETAPSPRGALVPFSGRIILVGPD